MPLPASGTGATENTRWRLTSDGSSPRIGSLAFWSKNCRIGARSTVSLLISSFTESRENLAGPVEEVDVDARVQHANAVDYLLDGGRVGGVALAQDLVVDQARGEVAVEVWVELLVEPKSEYRITTGR